MNMYSLCCQIKLVLLAMCNCNVDSLTSRSILVMDIQHRILSSAQDLELMDIQHWQTG